MVEEEQSVMGEVIDGHSYFQIDRDHRRGDRRSDGRLNADFFTAGESSMIIDNVRVSKRLQNLSRDVEEDSSVESVEGEEDDMVEVEPPPKNVPPVPAQSLKCAVRKRSTRLLWLHEFYIVYGNKRRKTNPYVYQSIQFLFGADVPNGVKFHMSDKLRREIWVLGVCYVPAAHVRKYSKRPKGYIFHNEGSDVDADKSLYEKCPEIVRVENFLTWHPMSVVECCVPRVVHAEDVKQRRVYVAGRGMHYVCGVTAIEDLPTQGYKLSLLPRGTFTMYPEERSGMDLNSPSMLWECVEDVFLKIRQSMSSARQGTSSATFKMSLSVAAYEFWKVCHPIDYNVVHIIAMT